MLAGRDWPESDDSCSWTCAGESQSPINVPLGERTGSAASRAVPPGAAGPMAAFLGFVTACLRRWNLLLLLSEPATRA